MLQSANLDFGINIDNVADCDFEQLVSLSNEAVLTESLGKKAPRVSQFLEHKMGIAHRYHCPSDRDALDLARSALSRLIKKQPELLETADFVIFCSISSPRPVTTISGMLAGEFGFKNASCWDLKSGCSTAVLALIQAMGWFATGAKQGVIIASETLSKFSNPNTTQMSAAVGDGAVALSVSRSQEWQVKSAVHGTDAAFNHLMRVPGAFPPKPEATQEDYWFAFDEKVDGLEQLGHYWVSSLVGLLQQAKITPSDVSHYVAHQVDYEKNTQVALAAGLSDSVIARNFRHYGNMGSPTVFLNWHNNHKSVASGEHVVIHAVGGGISWAGLCQQKL